MNIITIDNNRASLDILTTAVEKAVDTFGASENVNIHSFASSPEALEFARKNSCDIVFTDTDMRAIDGIGLVYKLRELNPRVNVIFVTESPFDAFEAVQLQLHLSGYILKPPTAETVLEELCNLWYPLAEFQPQSCRCAV